MKLITKEELEMKFCICEWSKGTVVLMTGSGHVLSYFISVNEALEACSEWYESNKSEMKYSVSIRYKQDKEENRRFAAVA